MLGIDTAIIIVIIQSVTTIIISWSRYKSSRFEKTMKPYILHSSANNRIKKKVKAVSSGFLAAYPKLKSDYKSLLIRGRNYVIEFSEQVVIWLYSKDTIKREIVEQEVEAIFDLLKIPTIMLVDKELVFKLSSDQRFRAKIHSFTDKIMEIIQGKYNGKSLDKLEDTLTDFMVLSYSAFIDKIVKQK